MEKIKFPKSESADICLLLEGSYPFAKGGLANWVYELIRVFPQYSFAVIFLGTKKKDYNALAYPLLKNVVHLDAHFLYDKKRTLDYTSRRIKKKTMKKIECMHDKFENLTTDPSGDMSELFDLMKDKGAITKKQFLRSRTAWEFIEKQYEKNYPDQSFFDYFWGVRNLHYPFWTLKRIVNHIPRVKILHSASTGYAGFLGALLQKKYDLPYIITEHGIYTRDRWIELMRHYFFEKAAQENKIIDKEMNLSNMWVNFFKIMAKVGYNAANPIISLFDEDREYQIKEGAVPDRTRIISYGIDFEHYKFLGKKGPNKDHPVIGFIGRIVPFKDVKTFIRAMALIIQRKPGAEAWIAGSMHEDPEYVTTCKNLVEFLGLQDKIKFLGVRNIMEIYSKIDLVIMTSISEGSPFAILESFAVGIPVVTTAVGACHQLIHGKNPEDASLGDAGTLVNIADPDGVAKAALELLNNESAWTKAQQIGLERVRRYYSMERLVDNYSNIYKEAIATWQG